MATPDEAARVASLVQSRTQEADRELAALLETGIAQEILATLLRWRDPLVRFWALPVAERAYSERDYVKVLERAARDPDDDVSADAIDRLLNVAPDRAQRMSKSIARRIAPNAPLLENVFWIWSLARLQARDALPVIEELRASEPGWTKVA
jgi:hypothetical protein